MGTEKTLIWTQIVTGIAVVVGLMLVIWELQQAREIARAQQISDSFSRYSQRLQAMMGEDSARAVAKACSHPKELALEDMLVLDKYYLEIVNSVRVAYVTSRVADDFAVFDWRPWVVSFEEIFQTEYGRYWWEKRSRLEDEIRREGDRVLAGMEIRECPEYWSDYKVEDTM